MTAAPRSQPSKARPEGRRICKCECGGTVRGIDQFDRLWTWCESCTPVVTISRAALQSEKTP